MSNETYLLVDIEADGPVPGRHSMLSFAAVAFKLDRTIIGTFERNLEQLPGATTYAPTMKWWEGFPEAWAACRTNPLPPAQAMTEFLDWLWQLPHQPVVFTANPISYDWVYMHYYLHTFTGFVHSISEKSPLSLNALDMHSYSMAALGKSFRGSGKGAYLPEWKAHKLPHTHKAMDDAMEHAMTFCAMAESVKELHRLAKLGKKFEESQQT